MVKCNVFLVFLLLLSCSSDQEIDKNNISAAKSSDTIFQQGLKKTKDKTKESLANLSDSLVYFKAKNKKAFYDIFPDNYSDFIEIFGFTDESFGPLYEDAYSYIDAFLLEDNKKATNKIFQIVIEGKWQSDGVAYYQERLRNIILNDPKRLELFLKEIDSNQNKIDLFTFLLYSPAPTDSYNIKFNEDLKTIISDEFEEIITIAQQEILDEANKDN